MDNIKKRRVKRPSGNDKLNARTFLGKDGSTPYLDPETLFQFTENAREEDFNEFDAFFKLVKENLKMAINRRELVDRGGNPYKYENFIRPKGPEGVKVPLIGNMKQFIIDYQAGKFSIDFTLEDLIAEAEQA